MKWILRQFKLYHLNRHYCILTSRKVALNLSSRKSRKFVPEIDIFSKAKKIENLSIPALRPNGGELEAEGAVELAEVEKSERRREFNFTRDSIPKKPSTICDMPFV